MLIENRLIAYTLLALLVALVVSFLMTPIVKTFAYMWGPSTYPRTPAGCTRLPSPGWGDWPSLSASWSASCCLWRSRPRCAHPAGSRYHRGAGRGGRHHALPALLKFVVQIVAALIPATHGVVIQAFSNPNVFSDNPYWVLGNLSVPLTVLWIVAITNAVNLIDGLDGLANGVSAISATTVLVIALIGGAVSGWLW